MAKYKLREDRLDPKLKQQLAAAQKQADAFNRTKKTDIYGKPNFSVKEDLHEMRSTNLIDVDWEQTTLKEIEKMGKEQSLPEVNSGVDAAKAAGFTVPEVEMPQQGPLPEEANSSQEQEPKEEKPLTFEQKLDMVTKELESIYKGSPSKEQLIKLKEMHGGIFILDSRALGVGSDIFIYRYLKRAEYIQVMQAWGKLEPDKQNIAIVNKCLIWPRLTPEFVGSSPAGMFELLAEQIRIRSMFLDPTAVASVTMKL
jgi:hypothetical protein